MTVLTIAHAQLMHILTTCTTKDLCLGIHALAGDGRNVMFMGGRAVDSAVITKAQHIHIEGGQLGAHSALPQSVSIHHMQLPSMP
jgi:hypothetical protein